MAEQSSTVVMFRAIVMLVCLIAIPLAALFGSSLPGVVKALQEGRWPTLSAAVPASVPGKDLSSEPARFVPSGPGAATMPPVTGPSRGEVKGPAAPSDSPSLAPRWPGNLAADRMASGVVPADYEAAVSGPGKAGPAGSVMPADPRQDVASPGNLSPVQSGLPPLVPMEPSRETRPPETSLAMAEQAHGSSLTGSDPFTQIQDRLRHMGATYYVLESWGGQEQQYRFYCKMAVGGNANYTRYFEAIDLNPLQAMSQVLQQVESWRSGRL